MPLWPLAYATDYPTRFEEVTWDDANWRITTQNLEQGAFQPRMSLANGYLGINVAALGPFFEVDDPADGAINGWPLFDRRQTFATISGFWDQQTRTNGTNFAWLYEYDTGESVISGVPHWSGLQPMIHGEVLGAGTPADEISGFESTMDFKNGVLSWAYTWSPRHGAPIEIEYTMFVHKLYVNRAVVQLRMTSLTDANVTVIDILNGDNALRTDPVGTQYGRSSSLIQSAVSPNGVPNVTAHIVSLVAPDSMTKVSHRRQFHDPNIIGGNSSSIAQALDVSLQGGSTAVLTKFVGGASTDAFSNPGTVAYDAAVKGAQMGYGESLKSHIQEWNSILTEDSVDSYHEPDGSLPDDPNVQELQITAITTPFQLLQQTIGANAIEAANNNTRLNTNSIAVGGLGSESYAG